MKVKGMCDVSVEWAIKRINCKVDIIGLVEDKYSALKLALALGLCEWRYVCGREGCLGAVSLVERKGLSGKSSGNLWWRCCRPGCRLFTSTLRGTLFEGYRASWRDLIITIWETCYDARTTSQHVAMVSCLRVGSEFVLCMFWVGVSV